MTTEQTTQHPNALTLSTSDTGLVLPVDREHTGIRVAGCGVLVAVWAVTLGLTMTLFNLTPVVALLVALVIGVLATSLVERLLKGRWPSGRELLAGENQIALRKSATLERQVHTTEEVNVLAWYFVVDRSRRVRKGWHVVGLSLQQEGEYLPVYTLASPEEFESLNDPPLFKKLERPKRTDDRAKTGLRQAGEQRRLLEAEQDRGYNGAELTVDDFRTYLAYLQTHHADWLTG